MLIINADHQTPLAQIATAIGGNVLAISALQAGQPVDPRTLPVR